MKESKYFMRAEDEMDFIPIIPLNEQEGETGNGALAIHIHEAGIV